MQVCLAGILRGIGKTHGGSVINFVGFWLISFPLAIVFGFVVGWKIYGFWVAMMIGLASISLAQFIYISCLKWSNLAADAQERTKKEVVELLM